MRVVILAGAQPAQRALAHRAAAGCELAAIVECANVPRRPAPRPAAQRLANATAGLPFALAWRELQRGYAGEHPSWPTVPVTAVANVHDEATLATVARHAPAVVAVSGTTLLGPKLIAALRGAGPILNLHTGLSPYVKGGPNCTNWCLVRRRFDLIGSTVLWLDAGVDSGDLLATERPPLSGRETLTELHRVVMDHAHDLYARALAAASRGEALPRVPQSRVAAGETFTNADWTPPAMLRGVWNHLRHYRPRQLAEQLAASCDSVRLFPLPPS